jgi:protein-S-isoprenylcysteine O-methyltransferase Ste14
MNLFKKWSKHRYSDRQRLTAIILGGIFFWIVTPAVIVVGSFIIDQWLHLPRFVLTPVSLILGILLIILGWLFANWTVKVQYALGKGTPIPFIATQRLVIKGPYKYCRNPMTLGTMMVYLGVAIWLGSLSGLALALIYPVGILIYIKLIEEKELEDRFGSEYVEYKKKTPFLIPRLRKGNHVSFQQMSKNIEDG